MPKLSSDFSHPRHPYIVGALATLLFLSAGSLYYWRANSVRLTADGKTRRIFTKAHTLREFLEEERIPLGPDDFTIPSLETRIDSKTAAKVTRVERRQVVEISTGTPIVRWQVRNRQNLRRVLVQRGYAPVEKSQIEVIAYDGVEVKRAVVQTKKTRLPFYKLTLLSRAGRPVREYDLLRSKVLHMRATGYYVGEKTVPSDTTFLGHKLQRGLVAVDPKVIPLRTRLYVQGYGYSYASDTGSAIKGLRIDLAVKDKYEEARFNRHNVPVYILEKAKSW